MVSGERRGNGPRHATPPTSAGVRAVSHFRELLPMMPKSLRPAHDDDDARRTVERAALHDAERSRLRAYSSPEISVPRTQISAAGYPPTGRPVCTGYPPPGRPVCSSAKASGGRGCSDTPHAHSRPIPPADTLHAHSRPIPPADPQPDADFIVVGAGSSGCVIARRLAERGFAVLLVETGGDPLADGSRTRGACCDPLRAAELWRSPGWMGSMDAGGTPCDEDHVDYAFTTEPEPGLGGRRVALNSGRALGGGSAINNGLYGVEWAAPEANPWVEWHETYGLEPWAPNRMSAAVARARATVRPQPPAEHARLAAFDLAIAAIAHPTSSVGTPSRVAWCVDEQSGSRRVSASTAYLPDGDAVAPLPLRLMLRCEVASLVLRHDDARCVGIETVRGGADRGPRRLHARLEVIVCCGAILTPALLLRSGIGPPDELEAVGIPCRLVSPHVGKHLITQPSLPISVASDAPPPPWHGPPIQPVAPAKVRPPACSHCIDPPPAP